MATPRPLREAPGHTVHRPIGPSDADALPEPEPDVRALPRGADAPTAGPTKQAADATGSAARGPVAGS
ncbi:hypothetical protein [Streptomyces milbemycinicus]|uniref:hypothetical protein n=1 Tax=Streptomyces milbemycinicus TaxID=476552 RepID=UPI00340C1678